MKIKTVNALLKEERKALQFLHAGYGFDFESPFFIKKIEGKFTFNMVKKAIEEKLPGDYTAAALVLPEPRWKNDKARLHIMDIGAARFNIPDRRALQIWKYNIDEFYGVGDFEETRKNKTKAIYIIAQNNEFLKPQKARSIDPNKRYKINTKHWRGGVETCGDGCGNSWIEKIEIIPRDGWRGALEYITSGRYMKHERSNDINDYIDKSGYLIHSKRKELKARAIDLKKARDLAALEKADFTAREKELKEKLNRAKAFLAGLVEKAQTSDDARTIGKAQNYLLQVFWKWERIAGRDDYFSSIAQKEKYLDDIEILTNAILLIEEA